MKEQLISFETAVLAKEKGFKEPTKKAWVEIINKESNFFGSNKCRDVNASKLFDYEYYAPTQSLLQKWLREKHNIHISIDNNNYKEKGKWCFDLHKLPVGVIHLWKRGDEVFNSYEEALEKGLQEALKLIK